MEGSHRVTAVVLLALSVILVLAAYERHASLSSLEEALAQERASSSSLQAENQELLEAVISLRQRIVEQQENLSSCGAAASLCAQNRTLLAKPVVHAPRNRVTIGDLLITDDQVIINMGPVTPGIVAPTRSMVPLMDENTIVLEVTPKGPSDILIGDIIIYELGDDRIIHRVVATGWDAQGWFAITKGDSNPINDPQKVRFPQVRGVVIGIIY